MTPLALVRRELQVLEQVPEREQRQERAAQLAQELLRRAQQEPLELQARVQEPEPVLKLEPQEQLWQEPEPAPELRVSLERLPLRQGSTQHI